MKIRIVTEREFPDSEWDEYVRAMKEVGSPLTDLQFEELKRRGKLVIDHRNYDKALTIYEIIERDGL